MELNQSRLIVGVLLVIETTTSQVFRFQNFFKDNSGIFNFENHVYNFLPIEYNPPERNINLDNFENTINLPAIPEIINLLESYNFLINASVESKIILQGFPNVPVILDDIAVISSYSIQDGSGDSKPGVSLVLQSPDTAFNNLFPNTFYFTGTSPTNLDLVGYIPNVPLSNNANLR